MDNELSFRGTNKHPRSLGLLMKLALSNGVSPMFIQLAEPWRNGVIEKFNNLVQQKFLLSPSFTFFEELKPKAEEFSLFHNEYHRYSTSGQKTPEQLFDAMKTKYSLTKKIDMGAFQIVAFYQAIFSSGFLSTSITLCHCLFIEITRNCNIFLDPLILSCPKIG
jgi:hypothetical protein